MIYIKIILIISLILSISGYIFAVLREKYYLRKNIIIIDNKYIKKSHLKGLDMNSFIYNKIYLKTGDELKIITQKKTYKGILLGGKFNEGIIRIVIKPHNILEIRLNEILKLKVTKKYGKFFAF